MTDDIPALRQQLTDAGLPSGPMHDALNELERTRAERKSYEELYADALADAKSDAQDFESDLWIEVRKFLTEINLDWRDYAEDGILAEQAVEYIRECMDEETRRAETAEADRDRLAGELAEARAFIAEFAAAKIEALRQPPCHPEDEIEPVVEASEVWAWQEDARAALNRKDTP